MSHVFISYTHADKPHLEKLLAWLGENGFAKDEIWYDQHIGSGNNWRDEISAALNEAFAVIVIVSTSSVKSVYCTYEWAYAMGQGIPIMPLSFDEINIADVPTPLASKQFTTCADGIPDYLKEQINQTRNVPPQVAAINKRVYETIYETHRRFFILGWIGRGLISFDEEFREHIISYFAEEASEAQQTLETLMTDKAFAFSGKQYRLCWKLISFFKDFTRLQRIGWEYLHERLFPRFDSEWLPAFEYFEPDKRWGWRRWTRRHFEYDLANDHNRLDVYAELFRAFPMFQGHDVDMIVHNAIIDQKNDSNST